MQSILRALISRHQFAIKPYDSYGTNRASIGCLFRYLEQFGYVKKKKKKTHNGKFADIKVHLYCKSRLVTINGVLDYIIKSVQAIPSIHTVQAIPSKRKEEKDGDGRESGLFQKKKKRGKGNKGERHNEKKTRRRRRGKRWGQRREKEEEADEKAVEPERKEEKKREEERYRREGGRRKESEEWGAKHAPPSPFLTHSLAKG